MQWGAVMRVPVIVGKIELVAWGLRNPFGLAFCIIEFIALNYL
jgi:hypothetical protein